MEFQVISDRQLGPIRAGRSNIVFRYRKNMQAVAHGVEKRNTDTGEMNVSSVELTALDIVRHPRGAGGFDPITTVLVDLGERIDGARLSTLAGAFERSVGQSVWVTCWIGWASVIVLTGCMTRRLGGKVCSGWSWIRFSAQAHERLLL